jgi:hypothetical protein
MKQLKKLHRASRALGDKRSLKTFVRSLLPGMFIIWPAKAIRIRQVTS